MLRCYLKIYIINTKPYYLNSTGDKFKITKRLVYIR